MHPKKYHHASRAAGVLLHITSLPSALGCGDLGPVAREFAVRLATAGQRLWQILPLNPTSGSAGDSPYFSNSAQAGNPLMISLEDLAEDGLLIAEELPVCTAGATNAADFERARNLRLPLLKRAAERHRDRGTDVAFDHFCQAQASWLDDHALFTALREPDASSWSEWPEDLQRRQQKAMEHAGISCMQAIDLEKRVQYLFARQWQRLRSHCRSLGVELFGDMPIYVNYDSADVWANQAIFKLDDGLRPTAESGVPPDYFSATGQLWRNPVYDWTRLERSSFDWWVTRISTQLERFDLLRIDHFRGLVQYWEVPAGAENAIGGHWEDVPSHALFDTLRARIQPLPVVAEDLGTITPDVQAVRDHYGFPGMIVLHFAFGDDHHDNPYIPHNHSENAVAYLGTHDNNTTRGWLEHDLDDASRARLQNCLGGGGERTGDDMQSAVRRLIDLLLSSRARMAIVCAQDLLTLPTSARMNTPGKESENWHWQLSQEQFDELPLEWLAERCAAHGR